MRILYFFTAVILRFFVISYSVCPWQAFQAQSHIYGQGQERTQEWSFTQVGSGLAHKSQTRLERAARDKNSSLLRTFINYSCKKFYDYGPRGQFNKTFFVRDLQIFVLSQSVCQTRLENLTNDKHSSLLQKYVIYVRKKFYNIGPRHHVVFYQQSESAMQTQKIRGKNLKVIGRLDHDKTNMIKVYKRSHLIVNQSEGPIDI